jgi:alpha-mannosidase
MVFLEQRIKTVIDELGRERYPRSVPVTGYKFKKSQEKGIEKLDPASLGWETFAEDAMWGGHREYFWFTAAVTVPEDFAGEKVEFALHTGTEDEWDATNAQFRAYVDGVMAQGLDANHRSFVLTGCAAAGERHVVSLYAFTGDNNFHLLLASCLRVVNEATEKLYYDLRVPCEAAALLDEGDKRRMDTINCLNEAVNLLDLRKPYSKEFDASVARADEYLEREFYCRMCGGSEAEVWCVGHTHIDVAWLWTLSVTRDKAFRSFATVLELMRRYPEYIFMSSQPQLYKYVKEESPELYGEIKKRAAEGRWEPEGAMFLEADCNLASGESLVRQILAGKKFFKDEFGADNKILWLPDVFGYSAALPQIMKKSGLDYFMTTKISWNDTDKFPYDTFVWQGIDGSKVLCHFITASEYEQDPKKFYTTYNAVLGPSQLMGSWKRYQQKELGNKVLMAFGYGDGGGGPTQDMLEEYRRLSRGIPGCPKAVMTTAKRYFDTLSQEVGSNRFLPEWEGELYLEYHRGTYTNMSENKKYNRRSEFMTEDAELAAVTDSALLGGEYPRDELREIWETILRNQFHDILPGSAIKEVYDESHAEYERVLAADRAVTDTRRKKLAARVAKTGGTVTVFNPTGFELDEAVVFDLPRGMERPALTPVTGGQSADCQPVGGGRAVFTAFGLPPKGYRTWKLTQAPADVGSCGGGLEISEHGFKNKFFDVRLDENCEFASLYDRRAGREALAPGRAGNVLTAYEDKPFDYDGWNIEMYYSEKSWHVDDVEAVKVTESGPVRGCIEIKRRFGDSVIIQSIYAYRDIARIDVKYDIDWHEKQVLLRASFPLDIHSNEAAYEIQFGNVTRPTHRNTSWDSARFEVCAHKWIDLSEDDFGFSLLNDSKYGFDVHGGVMGISLLKSAVSPNPEADRGRHTFTYSLYPHRGGWRAAGTVREAYALNDAPQAVTDTGAGGELTPEFSLVSCAGENVVTEAVKLAEDGSGVIVRAYECFNRRSRTKLRCGLKIARACECDLMENELGGLEVKDGAVDFEIKPYEIKTFKIIFA